MKLIYSILILIVGCTLTLQSQEIETSTPTPTATETNIETQVSVIEEETATSADVSVEEPSVEDQEENPYPQAVVPQPSTPAPPRKPPQSYGKTTGKAWIGQRVVTERHAGWGWLKPEGANWSSARWIMIKEVPNEVKAPQRFYNSPNADDGMQYRLYGEFADYQGYEPNVDAWVDVFVIEGFEVIGKGEEIRHSPPRSSGSGGPSRISERQPIQLRGSR